MDTTARLAVYASHPARSRGRRYPEAPPRGRDDYQRDRDRVVHCTAFRRLVYKTQVFVNHEGDLFRTRLTHSLEVAQLGRSIGRSLGLNEDLIEAVALAHDLGHAPFGHAGQDALHECMREQGGFEHNLQSLRVVDALEHRYPAFDGLNLCLETREGILKHCSRRDAARLEATEPRGPAHRFLNGGEPTLESQLTDLADEIAYNAHDIDDGVRSGLLSIEQLDGVALFRRHRAAAVREFPALAGGVDRRMLFETVRRMLSAQVDDVIQSATLAIGQANLACSEDAKAVGRLIRFSVDMQRDNQALKSFLFQRLYRHPHVAQTTDVARLVTRELFEAYLSAAGEMPEDFARREDRHRAVADYVAGMTDRFALREHQRLTGRRAFAEPPPLPEPHALARG